MGLKSARSRLGLRTVDASSEHEDGAPVGRRFGSVDRTAEYRTAEYRTAEYQTAEYQTADYRRNLGAEPANEESGFAMRDKTIGAELQAAREAADYEISDVAAHLRIRVNFLSAIEKGHAEALPGLTYAIGYVRTYAAFLALDPDDAVKRFKQEAAGAYEKTELSFPSPAPEGKVPGVGLMVMAAVLATVAYGGWYVMSERGMTLDDLVPAVPERLAELIDSDPATQAPSVSPAPSLSSGATGTETTTQSTGAQMAQVNGESNYSLANPGGDGVVDRKAVSETQAPSAAPSAAISAATGTSSEQVATATDTTAPRTESTAAPQVAAPQVTARQVEVDMPTVARAPVPPVAATELNAAQSADATGSDTAPTPPVAPESVSVTASAETAVTESVASETAVPETPTSQAETSQAAVPEVPGIPGIPAVPNDSQATSSLPTSRVMVQATGDSWIQIVDASGATLFTRILRVGDIYRVPSQAGLVMKTGNAGALTVLVDGEGLPSLGETGEVVRNIDLAPDALVARFGAPGESAAASSGAASTERSGSGSGSGAGANLGSSLGSGTATQ